MIDLRRIFAQSDNLIVVPGRMLLDDGPQPGMAVLLQGGRFAEIGRSEDLRARHPGANVADLPDHLMIRASSTRTRI